MGGEGGKIKLYKFDENALAYTILVIKNGHPFLSKSLITDNDFY